MGGRPNYMAYAALLLLWIQCELRNVPLRLDLQTSFAELHTRSSGCGYDLAEHSAFMTTLTTL